jgi:hypothetical protein
MRNYFYSFKLYLVQESTTTIIALELTLSSGQVLTSWHPSDPTIFSTYATGIVLSILGTVPSTQQALNMSPKYREICHYEQQSYDYDSYKVPVY